jgi:hypothetical protein
MKRRRHLEDLDVNEKMILWRIDQLLCGDSLDSGRCYVTAVTCTHATIEGRCFLCGPCRDVITRRFGA